MDQRQHNRWPQAGEATAFCLGGPQFGQIVDLKMFDMGHGGVGALSREPIEPGMSLSIGFEHSDFTARHGNVVACTPLDEGYRLAIRFEHALAA